MGLVQTHSSTKQNGVLRIKGVDIYLTVVITSI